MELSKFKTELSKLVGIDFHSPKFREVFKRYFGTEKSDDTADAEPKDVPDKTAEEKPDESADVTTKSDAKQAEVNPDADNETAVTSENDELVKSAEDDKEATSEAQKTETEAEANEPDPESTAEDKALEVLINEDSEESVDNESTESKPQIATEEELALPAADMSDELLTTKMELELVRAGIRDDRLETAKRLFMPEFKSSGGNTAQLIELIAQYPEWIGKQHGAQGFGMPLGDKADALTNEEKALKRMGINPRE